jgi:hypothetical protein
MTIYGNPGGTPLNNTGFQGTQPGNPVQATLQVVNPGVGLFPPNSNNNSGDSIMASISRGACPAGVLMSGLGVSGSGNKPVLSALSGAGQRGTGAGFVANGGSANDGSAGGNSFGAGGLNQTNTPGAGEITTLPANAPSSIPVIPSPNNFRG